MLHLGSSKMRLLGTRRQADCHALSASDYVNYPQLAIRIHQTLI